MTKAGALTTRTSGNARTRKTIRELEPLADLAAIFAALGSAPRLQLLFLLYNRPDLTVGEQAEILGVSISGVSMHLRRLRDAGLVDCRRDGKSVCCCLAGKSRHVRVLRDIFRGIAEDSGCCPL
jgi:ArsR family transcriptional regulator, lead/cadmium/zinc/bismuth-responsive transcriptional repressor